jgi:hypothetical protein
VLVAQKPGSCKGGGAIGWVGLEGELGDEGHAAAVGDEAFAQERAAVHPLVGHWHEHAHRVLRQWCWLPLEQPGMDAPWPTDG